MLGYDVAMKNKTKIKFAILLMLVAGNAYAQQQNSDDVKRGVRAHNFARTLLYWADVEACYDVSKREIRTAEKMSPDSAMARIPTLVRDSTYFANELRSGADIINSKYTLNEHPDNIYTIYELLYVYDKKNSDKNSPDYIMADKLHKYVDVIKELKLARYAIRHNDNHK